MPPLIDPLNAALTAIFDLLCLPFRALPPIVGLAAISCVSGVLLVWLFGRLSDQDRIREVRDRIRGNLLGVRLFRRDVAVVLRLQRLIVGDTLRFLRLAAVPMLILAAPVVLVMVQLHLRFAVRPIEPGAAVVVTVTVREASTAGAADCARRARGRQRRDAAGEGSRDPRDCLAGAGGTGGLSRVAGAGR